MARHQCHCICNVYAVCSSVFVIRYKVVLLEGGVDKPSINVCFELCPSTSLRCISDYTIYYGILEQVCGNSRGLEGYWVLAGTGPLTLLWWHPQVNEFLTCCSLCGAGGRASKIKRRVVRVVTTSLSFARPFLLRGL